MDKTLRNAVIAGIIIIALSVGYYLVIFIPKKEAMRLEQQKQEADQQRQEQEANAIKEQEKTDKEKQTRADCYSEAIDRSVDLEKVRASIDKNNENLQKAAENNLYRKDDFNNLYEVCLSKNGLQ